MASGIFFLAFVAALIGIFFPYLPNVKRKHFAGAAGVSLFLMALGIGSNNNSGEAQADSAAKTSVATAPEAPSKAKAAAQPTEPEQPASKWEYREDKDEMRGTTAKFASIRSENTVDLDFPYGEVNGTIWVRRRPEDGLDVMFSVDSGQIMCNSFTDTYVSIKFDDKPIQRFSCTGSSDGSNDTAFLMGGSSRALTALKKAKRTIIEAEFFQKGRQQFVFETAGLEWK